MDMSELFGQAQSNNSTKIEGGKFVYKCSKPNDSKPNGEILEFGRENFPGQLASISHEIFTP